MPSVTTSRSTYRCPLCKTDSTTEVIDSRSRGGFTHRRRSCNACNKRFSTVEIPATMLTTLNISKVSSKARTALNAFIAEFNTFQRAVHDATKRGQQ